MLKGQVVSGEFGKIVVRQKSSERFELGELVVADSSNGKVILQVYDLLYGSQISQQNLELISGLKLEEDSDMEVMDAELRNYTMALLKPMIVVNDKGAALCKELPNFFSSVREIEKSDLKFLDRPEKSLFIGKLRSGSKVLDVDIALDGEKVFSHHILIPATTGRGKSNLMSVILWEQIESDYCGILVLDPHDEYYGRDRLGLKDHPRASDKVVYYTPINAPMGCKTLKINIKMIKPQHFSGVVDWSGPQLEALTAYYKNYGDEWIEAIILEKPVMGFQEGTLAVVKRRMMSLLSLEFSGNTLYSKGVFDIQAGETTIKEICNELEKGKIAIIDTSIFSGSVEILVGGLVANEIFNRYRRSKMENTLKEKPVVSIVLEEAPRVLGKEVLERGSNIFSTIAREGRKFKVGLVAITQLPSLIPREILANMNTKIVLGIEMQPERQAIIDSASQDLSTDSRSIASLDRGEAIVTSNFSKFAIPIKIPLFEDFVKAGGKKEEFKKGFSGIKLG